jgi:hypothetical protein
VGKKTNPDTAEELANNARSEISAISGENLQRINSDVFRKYTGCIKSGGQHFQHLL